MTRKFENINPKALAQRGFISDHYKAPGKIQLRRLSGNSAWEKGADHAITE